MKSTLLLQFFLYHYIQNAQGFLKFGPWNCRTLACFHKEGQTITSLTLRSWTFRTCGSIGGLSCSAANDRVASRCKSDLNKKSLQLELCKKKNLPLYPRTLSIWVTKMGKANCMSNNANNFWMDKDSHGVPKKQLICCTKYKRYPWDLVYQVHAIPAINCA